MTTNKKHKQAFAAGDLMAIAEEAGGARMAENVAQVTREDIERIICFVKEAEKSRQEAPPATRSSIPVEASIAWAANAFDTERKAVMVEGRSWYWDDHPKVAKEAPAAAGAARAGALTRQQVYDRFSFLEGLVSEGTYRKIAQVAIEIQRSALAATPAPETRGGA